MIRPMLVDVSPTERLATWTIHPIIDVSHRSIGRFAVTVSGGEHGWHVDVNSVCLKTTGRLATTGHLRIARDTMYMTTAHIRMLQDAIKYCRTHCH